MNVECCMCMKRFVIAMLCDTAEQFCQSFFDAQLLMFKGQLLQGPFFDIACCHAVVNANRCQCQPLACRSEATSNMLLHTFGAIGVSSKSCFLQEMTQRHVCFSAPFVMVSLFWTGSAPRSSR